jgi:hypothetical protein
MSIIRTEEIRADSEDMIKEIVTNNLLLYLHIITSSFSLFIMICYIIIYSGCAATSTLTSSYLPVYDL